jgi:acetamidase/formamidase
MRSERFKHLKKLSQTLLLLVGAWMFLAQAGGHDLASAGQQAPPLELTSNALQDKRQIQRPDWFLPSRPENIAWGWFPLDKAPVLMIQSGDSVRINTLTGSGATGTLRPEEFFAPFGVQPGEILPDVFDFWTFRAGAGGPPPEPREGRSGHLLTGPIYIADAEPGDTLEVQILDVKTRVPYGINNTSPNGGVLGLNYPGRRPDDPDPALSDIPAAGTIPGVRQHLYRTTKMKGRDVALFSESIHVPLGPFMGVMGVAPLDPVVGQPGVTVPGVQASGPPGRFGGNMDLKQLTAGTTLYLPVFRPGAQFYTGDPHSAQGDGEVSGTAIEHSLTGVFRFILHKGKTIEWPRAENDEFYIMMGIDLDLNRAMRIATLEVVKFLVEEKGLTQAKAFSLASIAVDFRVAEVVDGTQVITGNIPKSLFIKKR